MNDYLQLRKLNCKNCYKCIRHCPVKSISFSDNQAHIIADECILCGTCFVVCPQNAKQIRNDVSNVKKMIADGKTVIASIAPSFIANYDNINIRGIEAALNKLGFAKAEETAVGATIVKHEYEDIILKHEQSVIISSCCHTVNTMIQKYYPNAIRYLAHTISPMQAHCQKLKKENPDVCTVFIGPCISKKEEAEKYPGTVDAVLTFEELSEWFEEENIVPSSVNVDDISEKGRARLFPTVGGIIRSMTCFGTDYSYITVDGIDNCINAVKDILDGKIKDCFIEMSACTGSCIGGPAMDKQHKLPIHDFITVDKYAGDSDFKVNQPNHDETKKKFNVEIIQNSMPSAKMIEEILHKMGKITVEQELNCGSCGYNTCREKAVAVYQGKADFTMCLPYLNEKAESFSDKIISNTPNGIMVINELLEVQQINKAACEIMNIKNPNDVLGEPVVRILNPVDYIMVMDSGNSVHDRKIYLAEYKRYVEESIIYDKTYKIIVSIMRDITQEEATKSKKDDICKNTIEVTDKVIEKQMRVVQEIASLLGETVAETKIALTNLKENLRDE